jgi:hypothetical protein
LLCLPIHCLPLFPHLKLPSILHHLHFDLAVFPISHRETSIVLCPTASI